ncbi:hypothetical protein [Nonlabens agnitus]|uniref:Uncharacterized protein n=1 Tax=Nonlabens agnitus TaxID=870484 RepID=A0A2S9WRA7_9FLAO|nr:hypothetical protein [Nonlabens agnitus]PRP66020.1 hypothetical protein BST86_02445 [Nonlabens agnitus]
MKSLLLSISLILLVQLEMIAQTEFVLEPSQSMIMTGKGPGQDATINPFVGQDCYVIVRNLGYRSFYIRIQNEGKVVEEITVEKGKFQKVKLLKGYELYLDPNPEGITKASVEYQKIEE